MQDATRKIVESLEAWRESYGADAVLGEMIAEAQALTEASVDLYGRLAEQNRKLVESFGAPTQKAIEELQDQPGLREQLGDMENQRRFTQGWQGADALLTAAGERGVELDESMVALIKYTDRVMGMAEKSITDALAELQGTVDESRRRIDALDAVDFRTVGLFVAASAYLMALLAHQILDRKDADFEGALKDAGIGDPARLVFGATMAGLPFAGLTHDFVTRLADMAGARPDEVGDSGACKAFLDVYLAQLRLWELGARQYATITESLIARGS